MTRYWMFAVVTMFLLGIVSPASADIECVTGLDANNNQVPCDWAGSGGGGGGTVHVPPPPDYSAEANNLGNVYWRQGDWEKATEQYRRALGHNPTNQIARDNLSKAYVNWGNQYWDAGNLTKAEWAYNQAINNGGAGVTDAYNGLGNIADKGEDYRRAIRLYEMALQSDPNNAIARSNLANTKDRARREMIAVERRTKQALLNTYADAITKLMADGNYEQALAVLRDYLKVRSNDPWAHVNMGIVFVQLGRYEEAIAAYRQSLAHGGNQSELESRIEHAQARWDRDRVSKAFKSAELQSGSARVRALNALIQRFPKRAGSIKVKIADAYREQGNMSAYRKTLEDYLRQGDDGTHAYQQAKSRLDRIMVSKANKAIEADDPEAKLEAIRALKRLRKPHPKLDRGEARALAELGRFDEGVRMLRDSVRRFPDNAVLHERLAWHLYRSGNIEEALKHARRAAKLDPHDETIQAVLEKIESYDGSVRHFVNENLFGTRPGESKVGMLAEKAKAWWQSEDQPTATGNPGLWDTAKQRVTGWLRSDEAPKPEPRMTAKTAPPSAPGAFGAKAPPSPIPGKTPPSNAFQVQVQRAFAKTPEPVVRLTKASVRTAKETWERAGMEAKEALKSTGLDWVASKLPKTQTLKSIIDKTAQVHGDYSAPIKAHFAYSMQSAKAAAATQAGLADLDAEAYEQGAAERGKAVQKMADDLARKSMEWGISGGILPDGSNASDGIHLGDRLVGYVEKVFRLDQLWAFNRDDEIEKWSAGRAEK